MATNAAGFTILGSGSAAKSTPFTRALTGGSLKPALPAASPTRATAPKSSGQAVAPKPQGNATAAPRPQGSATNYTAPVYVDPYAKWGGQANFQRIKGDYDQAHNVAFNSITDSENQSADKFHNGAGGVLDFLDSLRSGQHQLDQRQIQGELAKSQGAHSVLDTIGRGIRSSGVQLASTNSGTSSAAGALADAWGDSGRRQLASVNNQYAQDMGALASDQNDFNLQTDSNIRRLGQQKNDIVNGIVNDAVKALGDLNAKAASGQLDDRVDVEGEKNRIRAEAMGKLQAFDAEIAQGREKNKAIDNGSAKGQAAQLEQAGVASTQPFKFDTSVPTEFKDTGPFSSQLPVFTIPKPKTDQ